MICIDKLGAFPRVRERERGLSDREPIASYVTPPENRNITHRNVVNRQFGWVKYTAELVGFVLGRK